MFISKCNTKLGEIANISLSPVKSCVDNIICAKECYALNITRHYPHVRSNWLYNYNLYINSPIEYFNKLEEFISTYKGKYFRYHVGGDCPDINYVKNIINVASNFKHINFMVFSKRYSWFKLEDITPNFNIMLSAWPYIHLPRTPLPISYIRGDLRAPINSFICEGTCTNCLHCWNLHSNPTSIILKPH